MKLLFAFGTLLCLVHSAASAQNAGGATGSVSVVPTVQHSASEAKPAVTPILYKGIDVSMVIERLKVDVVELDKPVTVYNWSQKGKLIGLEAGKYAQRASQSFWQAYGGSEGSQNMYGTGLYAAVDPVATSDYGGRRNQDVWHLLEMKLPKGLRMIDVSGQAPKSSSLSVEYVDAMTKFSCGVFMDAQSAFRSGGAHVPKNCRDLMKFIYKDHFKIQAFAYNYGKQSFKDCPSSYENTRAFVITSSNWMNANSVKYYSASTTDKLEDRRRIQTIFLKAAQEMQSIYGPIVHPMQKPKLSEHSKAMIAEFLDKNPSFQMKDSSSKCNDESCTIKVNFCEANGNCETLELEPIIKDSSKLITTEEALSSHFGKLMWNDLLGKRKTTNIGGWIKENFLMCEGPSTYVKVYP